MNIIKISDAEYEIMEIIWNAKREVTTADIMEKLEKNKAGNLQPYLPLPSVWLIRMFCK